MSKKQLAFVAAKVLFAAIVLTWLLRKMDLARVGSAFAHAERLPVLGGILMCWLTVLIGGWRWQKLLRVFEFEASLPSLIAIVQIGQFFLMFLPGPAGDDLTRMLYISRIAKGRIQEACTTVLLDRCFGLASVLVLALCCIPWRWHMLAASHQTHLLAVGIIAAGIALCVFGLVFFTAGHPTHRWFQKHLRALPAHSVRDEAARIWGLLCDNKKAIAKVIAAATVTQLLLCILFYFAGLAVGIRLPFPTWLSFVPIVLAANALPITIAGFGVREYLLILFLGVLAHLDAERAIAASLVAFSMTLVVCLSGGVLYIFYRPSRNSARSAVAAGGGA